MFEAKLTITAPGLEAAINNLAAAIAGGQHVTPAPQAAPAGPAPQPQAPANPTQAATSAAPVQNAAPAAPMAGPTSAYPSNPPIPTAPAPVPGPAPQPVTPASYPAGAPLPTSPAPQYTVEQIMAAGATLMDSGKAAELMNLLQTFGVPAVTALKPEQLGAFATALRQLGAQI